MEILQLHLGKNSSKELAQWFNVSYKTFINKLDNYLTKLEDFCKFEKYRGGANILEIYQPTYIKNFKQKAEKDFYEEIKRCVKEQDGLATVSGIVNKTKQTKHAITCARDKQFGKTAPTDKKFYGLLGSRYATWGIKISNNNEYRKLTEEESDIFADILASYVKNKYTQEDIATIGELIEEFKHSSMTKEEFISCATRITDKFYYEVIGVFFERTGLMLSRVSCYELDDCFSSIEERDAYIRALNKKLE